MMALNIAVPLTTVGDLLDGFGLLSPISPLTVDCHGVTTAGSHGQKQLISPVGSESSGVSSLDSDDIKKPSSSRATPTEEVRRPSTSSPLPSPDTVEQKTEEPETAEPETATISETPGTKSSSSSSSGRYSLSSTDSISSSDGVAVPAEDLPVPEPTTPKVVKVEIGGRNVLDLLDNLTSMDHFNLQFAQLPENDNIHFFLDNRSQYHRLGANGHIQEYTMVKCKCCDFRYPVNGTSPSTNGAGTTTSMGQANLATIFQQQQQQQHQAQQQQTFQWKNFNNYDSISNRNKMGVNVAVNAFNKTFGGGSNGSQYLRNNMNTSLFGRDSNRNSNNSGGNFFNSNSTSTYNNQKAYQQGFGSSNSNGSNKFSSQYGNYQFQQQQQSQPLFSKNQQMRYAISNSNGTAALAAAASALANQNMLNFNNFNSKNNIAAYFDARMN